MKKIGYSLISGIILINLLLVSSLFMINGYGAIEEIDAEFGEAPIIDGEIDDSTGYIELDRVYTCSLPRPGLRVDIPLLTSEV